MTGAALAVPLALTWFLVVNLIATAAVSAAAMAWAARQRRVERPALLLALRLLPGLGAAAFVVAVFVPAHARFEPVEATETLGLSLALLAAVGLYAIVRAAWRAGRALEQARAARRRWMRSARPLDGAAGAGDIPCFVVEDSDATVSLVGIVRPAVFVSARVASALDPDELALALAHERAHVRALDNLKRLLVAACPDALPLGWAGAWLERQWHAAAECAADASAAAGRPIDAVRLASALLAVARVAPSPMPAAAWSRVHDTDLLEERVRRLLSDQAPPASRHRMVARAGLAALAVAAILAGSTHTVLASVHHATELAVRLLP
jgi:beta-lactamase regulating signal transducer with metallopeptidase domain